MKKLFIIISILIVFASFLIGCNQNLGKLPNLKLAIKFEHFISGFDDQLYELNENGTLKVTLCKLEAFDSFDFANAYNTDGELVPCSFKSKTVKLSMKQRKIILDLFSKLKEQKTISKRVSTINDVGETSIVYIQIEDEVPYSCTYIEDYKTSNISFRYSPEILDMAYRFIDFAPIEARKEWIIGDKPGRPGTGGVYRIHGSVFHNHKWE